MRCAMRFHFNFKLLQHLNRNIVRLNAQADIPRRFTTLHQFAHNKLQLLFRRTFLHNFHGGIAELQLLLGLGDVATIGDEI